MACEKCNDLCVRYPIRRPNDLLNAIKIAKQNIEDGTILELPDVDPMSQVSFAALAGGEAWDDLLSYRFKCKSCGESFILHAETYHGSGGYWEPENKRAVRETL